MKTENIAQEDAVSTDNLRVKVQRDDARQRVKIPAVALMVLTVPMIGIGLLTALPATLDFLNGVPAVKSGSVVFDVSSLVSSVIILVGAATMRELRFRKLAITASVLACIPMLSPFAVFGIPFGIWALVLLFDPEIKIAFDGVSDTDA